MYCRHCGQEILEQAVVCPHCGCETGVNRMNKARPDDAKSAGWAVLCFFFPLVGLILYLVWREEYPLRSKSCGKGALINVIVSVALFVLYFILVFILLIVGISVGGGGYYM